MTAEAMWPEAPVTKTRMVISSRRGMSLGAITIALACHLVSSTTLCADVTLEAGRRGPPDQRRDRAVRRAGLRGDDRRRDRRARGADEAHLLPLLLGQARGAVQRQPRAPAPL